MAVGQEIREGWRRPTRVDKGFQKAQTQQNGAMKL